MPDPYATGNGKARTEPGRKLSKLATLAEIGRVILQAELDQDALCELIYGLAGRIVSNDTAASGGPTEPMITGHRVGHHPRRPVRAEDPRIVAQRCGSPLH